MRSFFTTLAALATLALGLCAPAMAREIAHTHDPTCLHGQSEFALAIGLIETIPIFVLSDQLSDPAVKFRQTLTARLAAPRADPGEWQAMQRIADLTFLAAEPRAPDKAAQF
ncbi:hypothetical protein [Oceaniglobus trochenteri]|uniref:hypothetical protein n=1 Tax=Oceaniglobus trochenteri TaxID=2763260 RepID=UPI001CFFF9E5|nr:hypothetical protein [Oceaniglobus trochenteri]